MKLLGTLFAIIIILGLAGVLYVGLADADVPQKTVTKDITP